LATIWQANCNQIASDLQAKCNHLATSWLLIGKHPTERLALKNAADSVPLKKLVFAGIHSGLLASWV
jgi:hypothetical protein